MVLRGPLGQQSLPGSYKSLKTPCGVDSFCESWRMREGVPVPSLTCMVPGRFSWRGLVVSWQFLYDFDRSDSVKIPGIRFVVDDFGYLELYNQKTKAVILPKAIRNQSNNCSNRACGASGVL